MTIGLLFFSALRKPRNGSFNLLDACALPKGLPERLHCAWKTAASKYVATQKVRQCLVDSV